MVQGEPAKNQRVHATCVSVGSRGVLITGKSRSGKSDLALRLIAKGAMLVADDVVVLKEEDGMVTCSVDASIRGLLEIHGVGLVRYPVANNIPLKLVVDLVPLEEEEHLPLPHQAEYMGILFPKLALYGLAASAPDKIFAAMNAMARHTLHTGFLHHEP